MFLGGEAGQVSAGGTLEPASTTSLGKSAVSAQVTSAGVGMICGVTGITSRVLWVPIIRYSTSSAGV